MRTGVSQTPSTPWRTAHGSAYEPKDFATTRSGMRPSSAVTMAPSTNATGSAFAAASTAQVGATTSAPYPAAIACDHHSSGA
ncbi:hypothetical protein HUN58_11370 [Curtobacterium sp. Csp1]|nr:hypothetical protein HUN58_11370 [Curtobacterium sp. Csp1]